MPRAVEVHTTTAVMEMLLQLPLPNPKISQDVLASTKGMPSCYLPMIHPLVAFPHWDSSTLILSR